MNEPAISVLMTVFNAGRFFEPAIKSILAQTFRDFEFLIVDDASTDGSPDVAQAWAAKDGRLRVVRNNENKGQTACLNQGLRLARGKWTARQDADDLAHPLRLAKQHQFVVSNPGIVLLGTNGRIIDEHSRLAGLLDAPLTLESITWTAPFLNPFMHTSVLFRTDVIRDQFEGYNEAYRIAQDYELWTRVVARHDAANLPERLVSYRHLPTSLSKSESSAAFAEADQISAREARRAFGRGLSDGESDLIASFRRGLDPGKRRQFWKLYSRLLSERKPRPADLGRTVAMHHLKAAGAFSPKALGPALEEILMALRSDPAATLGWLTARYLTA